MMRYRKAKSKKGYTLVELVVTIAILAIISGMGISVIAGTLQNYSTASLISSEQEDAKLIEDAIVEQARFAKEIYIKDSIGEVDQLSDGQIDSNAGKGMYFLSNKTKDIITSVEYEPNTSGSAKFKQQRNMDFTNVKKLTFKIIKQGSTDVTELDTVPDHINTPGDGFFVLTYKIEMREKYVLTGAVVLNGVSLSSSTANLVGAGATETSDYVLETALSESTPSNSVAIIFSCGAK